MHHLSRGPRVPEAQIEIRTIRIPFFIFNNVDSSRTSEQNTSNVNNRTFLNVLYTNADCLSHTKLVELSNYCEHNSLDVIAISEILPKFSLFQPKETNYSLDGFDIFTSDLTSERGCALFVKQDLAATKITFTSNFSESVWCQINLKNNDKMIVGCIYRSPNSTIENNKELFHLLNSVNNKHFSHILIVGDFNCKEIDWRLQSTSVNENHVASQLLECIRDCFMYQHVAEPTRFRIGEISSVLDLIFTNEENMISELKYMAGLGKSDHLQLTFNFNCYIEEKTLF